MSDDIFSSCLAYIKAHRFAALCALAGLVLGILFLTLGFFKTLLVSALVAGGAFLGAWLDKRAKQAGDSQTYKYGNDD